MNRFADAKTIDEVVGMAVGAGSTCFVTDNWKTDEFDSTAASAVVNDAVDRIREIRIAEYQAATKDIFPRS